MTTDAPAAEPERSPTEFWRAVRDDDSPDLIRLIGDIWAEYPGIVLDVDNEEPWLLAPARAYAEQQGQCFVVESDARLLASVAWRPAAGLPGSIGGHTTPAADAELKALYVGMAARGRGLGASLVGAVVDLVRAAGYARLILWTDSRFVDAHRLYRRLGFTDTGSRRRLHDRSNTEEYLFVKPLQPPVTEKRPVNRVHHGDTFVDDYEWLRDRDNPDVLAHLRAENAYAEAVTEDQAAQRTAIFNEIKDRTQETDLSVPRRRGDWWYYRRMVEGKEYGLHCRVRATGEEWTPPTIDPQAPPADEVVMLDENTEAAQHSFYSLGAVTVSDDGNLLAHARDTTGNEKFSLAVRDLRTGEDLPDQVSDTFYGPVWSPDGAALLYLVVDDTWRPYEVRRHVLGTDPATDTVIFTESDPTLWVGIDRSADHQTLIIGVANSEVSEVRLLNFVDGDAEPRVVLSRDAGVLYTVEPVDIDEVRELVITHNRDGAHNSMVSVLAESELEKPLEEQEWRTVIDHDEQVRITSATPAAGHLFVGLRRDTVPTIGYAPLSSIGQTPIELSYPTFDEPLHACDLVAAELDQPLVRLVYETFLTPARLYDFDPAVGELILRKETPVRGDYRPENYRVSREWATADDGTKIPITVIRAATIGAEDASPTVVYGYGSYEISMDPGFSINRLSLLDRGVVFAIAHIRGGGELGRTWYESGKKLLKINSFTDFVSVTRFLTDSGWSDPARIAAMGGSAGGLLMGAVVNLAPELYRVVVAQVPFVDALTSILDPDLPLSALEWEEWGNPITDPQVYAAMKAYTPYENIRSVDYPRIAAVTSLDDTRVLFVEPAKWVARLREITTGAEPIVFKIEMDGGHGGGSGRYKSWQEIAWDYAFVLHGLGIVT